MIFDGSDPRARLPGPVRFGQRVLEMWMDGEGEAIVKKSEGVQMWSVESVRGANPEYGHTCRHTNNNYKRLRIVISLPSISVSSIENICQYYCVHGPGKLGYEPPLDLGCRIKGEAGTRACTVSRFDLL